VDNKGTADTLDDTALDGASFSIYADNGDGMFSASSDELVAGPQPAPDGFLTFPELPNGMYWVVEVVVPTGFTGTPPILVKVDGTDGTCFYDFSGFITCFEIGGGETIVYVDNTPAGATPRPTGGVSGETGVPRITLPPTDTVGASAPAQDGWRVALLILASLLGTILVVTPNRRSARRR
jgi:hypothetical protein